VHKGRKIFKKISTAQRVTPNITFHTKNMSESCRNKPKFFALVFIVI
jgi:hypothetical protein